MDINIHRGRKSTSPPAATASYLNIVAFDSMAFPAAGYLSLDSFDENLFASSNHGFHDMGNVSQVSAPEEYYEEPNEEDSPFSSQQLYQHHLQHQYHSNQSTDPSSLNTPSIEVRFEALYDNFHISNDKSTRRLSSNIHSRRRAQNRASQRAFRERKEQHVKEVETKLAEVESKYESLEKEYLSTKQELDHLKAGHRQHGGGREDNRLPESQHVGDVLYLDDVFFFDGDAGDQHYTSR